MLTRRRALAILGAAGIGDELALYTNLAGHPGLAFPRKFEKDNGFLVPRPQLPAGRAYDESTLLALADAY